MRASRLALSFALLASPLAAQTAAPAAPAAAVRAPKLAYRVRTLPNGMTVVSARDDSSPTVAIQVWYHVGSKDDPESRSGFAHLFEHIMFKSTKHMKAETIDRLTEDVGGYNNAYTAEDVTVYFDVIPSNHLERLLWAEAERLAALTVDEASFKSERDVVKEEYRQRILAPPYGRFQYALTAHSFTKHPYRRPGIGLIEDLDAASLEDVRAFHSTYYRPDSAALVVVGDFDDKDLDRWVDDYFARIPKPATPIPRVTVKEPPRAAETRFAEKGPSVPLPAVGMTYLVPTRAHPDAEALRMLAAVLAEGRSSRLYRSLVYEQRVAQRASAAADLNEDAGLFRLTAIVAGGKTTDEASRALLAEIAKLKETPPAAAELERARIQLVTGLVRDRETNNGKAGDLGEATVLLHDTERVNTDVARFQAVTAADVQRVARTYLTDANRMVVTYEQAQ
ncbi:MAG TPA: pitrilysin family protein [Thermoanaerobaculia bacterium]|nr:pitrilysin family protein [Thermoanaerobaculia bacterium]